MWKQLYRSLFSIKLQTSSLELYWDWEGTPVWVFTCEFCKILQNTFLIGTVFWNLTGFPPVTERYWQGKTVSYSLHYKNDCFWPFWCVYIIKSIKSVLRVNMFEKYDSSNRQQKWMVAHIVRFTAKGSENTFS